MGWVFIIILSNTMTGKDFFIPSEKDITMLGSVEIFKTLSHAEIAQVAKSCRWSRFKQNQEIVWASSPSKRVFFLLSGRVRVHMFSPNGREVTFDELGKGRIFGEIAAIDKEPRSANVVGISPGIIASMEDRDFCNILVKYPQASFALNEYFVNVIRKTSQKVMVLSSMEAYARIFHTIINSSRVDEKDDSLLLENLTHYDIAGMSGCTRETVSRSIGTLIKLGVAHKEGRALRITDKMAIEELILKYSN